MHASCMAKYRAVRKEQIVRRQQKTRLSLRMSVEYYMSHEFEEYEDQQVNDMDIVQCFEE